MRMSNVVLGLAMAACLASPALARTKAPTLRDREQAACYTDATTLCKEFVPDEAKITACMKTKIAQLSPGCRAFFGKAK